MPSPDVAAYVGLELLDTDAQQLLDDALTNLALSWPEWTPREGNTEVVLLEEVALMAEDVVHAVNRLPDGMAEVLLRAFGLTRDLGAPATALAEVTTADTDGHTIDAGTLLRLDQGPDTEPVDFTTDVDLVIPAGGVTGTVAITATTAGVSGNGHRAGLLLALLDAVPYVNTVTLASVAGGGRVAEDGAAFLARTIPRLSRLTSTLVRPRDVEAYVAERPGIERVKVLDLYDPAGGGQPGDDPGYVTVAVTAAGGAALPAPTMAALEADLVAAMHAGLRVAVVPADVTAVDVTVSVLRLPGYSDAEVTATVTAVLEHYLDPDRWDWSRVVRRNELIARADTALGVDTVLDVTVPAGDRALPGEAPLASAGTITVLVEAPA